jgi:acyl-CoA thioesterase-2
MTPGESPGDTAAEAAGPRASLDALLGFLRTRRARDGTVTGETPPWFGPTVFGGFVIGQTLHAATTAVDGRRPHSLHTYFLRPLRAGARVTYRVRPLREGRSFALVHVEAIQDDALACWMTVSFTTDTEGYEYELDVAGPIPPLEALPEDTGPGPWRVRDAGSSPPLPDGTRRSTRRAWFRLPPGLPDDPMVHAALAGMMSDMTGTGGRPLRLDGTIDGMISLDHAVWFHRPHRMDDWLYFDVQSIVNTGGRGTMRATAHSRDGRLVLSMAQEMLLRVTA